MKLITFLTLFLALSLAIMNARAESPEQYRHLFPQLTTNKEIADGLVRWHFQRQPGVTVISTRLFVTKHIANQDYYVSTAEITRAIGGPRAVGLVFDINDAFLYSMAIEDYDYFLSTGDRTKLVVTN